MADEAKPTNTPEFGCVTDLTEQQAATADPKKGAAPPPAEPETK